jgi:diguanylate cyclase (GGDEF)-like protein
MTAFSPESGPPSATLIQDLWSTLGRLESALATISDALCITDSERLVLWCNQQFEELVSAPRLALLGKPIEDLIQRLPFEDRRVDLRSTLQQHPEAGAIDMLMSKEPIAALRIEWSHVTWENPPSTIFTFHDISDQVTLEELRTQQIALISEETRFAITSALCPITGLKMRPSMLRDIEASLSGDSGQLYALLLFNIRAFRLINDRHGYATGDELLAEIARRLKQAIRSGDDLARMGGDQFAVFAKLSDIEELSAITRRLKGAVESTPFLPATTQAVVELNPQLDAASAVIRGGQSTAQSLLRAAEMALDRVQRGASSAQPADASGEQDDIRDELAISSAVDHCLQHNLIPIALQPMVLLESGAPYGYEALARPLTADGSPIPVHRFMALSEQLGLMAPIGELLIRSTFDMFRQARLAQEGMRLSLNLSPSQFAQPGITDRLLTIAQQFQMPLALLTVEITETALVSDESVLSDEVTALREKGVTVLLDDFGTGFSSLDWIFSVPTDGIKIDRSYTSAVTDPRRRLMMASLATMCRDLGLDAVVEGIETEEQRALLQELGFRKGQGYLFGKPTSLEALQTAGA